MRISSRPRDLTIGSARVRIRRTTGGVIELWADDLPDLMRGLGFAHALDRLTQMSLVRLVGQGRLCECLSDDDEALEIDCFMRQLGFAPLAQREAERCSPEARAFAVAYCEGVNAYLAEHSRPWGLRIAGYRPEPWEPADPLLTMLLMSYVGLAQTQQDLEKFLVQSVQSGVDLSRLRELFSPHLDGLSDEFAELIRTVNVVDPLVPALPGVLPKFAASNNWAVAPWKSASGSALECHDPHLACNRLPAVWYEVVLHAPGADQIGVTVPGVPGLIMGRTRNVSAGFTYGFMDMVDYFIEDCRKGKYRRGEAFHDFHVRRETIRRKSHPPVEIAIFENDLGTLERDRSSTALPDGRYLSRALSATAPGATAKSLHALATWTQSETVMDAQKILRDVSISCNWVLADRAGNIGYQQSGPLPVRAHSGLFPVPGWRGELAWKGIVSPSDLASTLNPPEGFIATANDDHNSPGKPAAINACQGPYRAERIAELLAEKNQLTIADMQRMQGDLVSIQARRFLARIGPLAAGTCAGERLRRWDLRYDEQSTGAALFEDFYSRLFRRVFGAGLFGAETWDRLVAGTNLLDVYFHFFDRVVLAQSPGTASAWFGGQTPEGIFHEILEGLSANRESAIRPWGERRMIVMQNLLLGGKLPRWINRFFPVDYGPVPLPGNRATLVQGAIFYDHGRISTFAPSYRFVTDLGTDDASTALAGGPSERVFSPYYRSDIERWRSHEDKTLRGTAEVVDETQ
jgi:penicillin amidase